jgi:hypothetical protein
MRANGIARAVMIALPPVRFPQRHDGPVAAQGASARAKPCLALRSEGFAPAFSQANAGRAGGRPQDRPGLLRRVRLSSSSSEGWGRFLPNNRAPVGFTNVGENQIIGLRQCLHVRLLE